MTFDEYIANPMGKSNAVLSGAVRESQRTIYTAKFDNIMLRENGRLEYYIYKQNKTASYFIHIKIPSEVVKDFYYDVVIKFTPKNTTIASSAQGLDKYEVQFYSNDPAFVYTYAYVFNKRGLFFQDMAPRMSKKALRQPANEKNPENQVGYVKSLYFAYLFMKRRGLFSKIQYAAAPEYNKAEILKRVENADDKIEKRQEEGAKVSKRKKGAVDEKTAKNIQRRVGKNVDLSSLNVKTTKKVKIVGKAQNASKRTRGVRSAKKI